MPKFCRDCGNLLIEKQTEPSYDEMTGAKVGGVEYRACPSSRILPSVGIDYYVRCYGFPA